MQFHRAVSVKSQRNKQIKCSLSSAHFLTFYFLGFGNEEKEKIFPTKLKLVEVWCFFFTQHLQPADTFLTAESPGGRNVNPWLKYSSYSPNLSRDIIISVSLWALLSVVITESISCENDEKIIGLRTQHFVRIFSQQPTTYLISIPACCSNLLYLILFWG